MSHSVDWASLQATFALGAPIVAVGPGCHRIGYRGSPAWGHVVRRAQLVWHALGDGADEEETYSRRAFLGHLWRARVDSGATDLGPSTDGMVGVPSLDELQHGVRPCERARIALATDLLCGLIEATRALGATIESGAAPVTDWDQVRDERNPESDRLRQRAVVWLRRATEVAAELATLQSDPAATGSFPHLAAHGLTAADGREDRLQLLKADRIHASLEDLCLALDVRGGHISGAMVEWLSDLLWHVLVSGGSVPLSQDELNFYLNLAIADPEMSASERRFSRPHPGEYRGKADGGTTLRNDLALLLGNYDAGLGAAMRDWRAPRLAFTRTIAASLLETWRQHGSSRLTVALVSDYDLLLERAMLELLDPGQGFHVVIPAVTNPGARTSSFEWLYGTIRLTGRAVEENLLRPEWRWFRTVPCKGDGAPIGPIFLRLTGSPLLPLGPITDLELEDDAPDGVSQLAAAALFSEHDSVRAIVALTQPQPEGQRSDRFMHDALFSQRGLAWDRRGWLFFGHRFSDWLPRLQLLFSALMFGRDGAAYKPQVWGDPLRKDRIAVSRRFDWPEEALLRSLTIDMQEVDLERVSRYYAFRSSYFGSSSSDAREVSAFLERVGSLVDEGLGPALDGGPAAVDATGDGEARRRPKVFLSYSHEDEPIDSAWNTSVRSLADLLVNEGIDLRFDQYGPHLNRDWGVWGPNAVEWADIVVCVASPRYAEDWAHSGASGAAAEARAVRAALQGGKSVIFAVLPGHDSGCIPGELRQRHWARVERLDADGIDALYRELTNQPAFPEPSLGPMSDRPPKR